MSQINNISSSQHTKETFNYIRLLNELRRVGAHFIVNIPTIVFCGSPSAGKSSLFELISGIKLEICTRCVVELRLTESVGTWSCQVSLRKEYDENEKRLSRPIETKFGDLINDINQVGLTVRRAQKALLNPTQDNDRYLEWNFNCDELKSDDLDFTKNVVCIEIKAPNVPNLSLIDLPGIIPHKLDLGYCIVNNQTKKQLMEDIKSEDDIKFEEANLVEVEFFEMGESWNSFYSFEKAGINQLQQKLAELLIQAIEKDLPDIRKSVEDKLDEVCRDLESIPMQLSDNSKIEFYRMVKNCSTIIKTETMSSNDQIELWKSFNNKFTQFKKELYVLRPIFSIGCEINTNKKLSTAKFDMLDDFIEDHTIIENSIDQLQQITEAQLSEKISNAGVRLLPGFTPYSAAKLIIQENQAKWKKPAVNCLNAVYEVMLKLVNSSVEKTFSRFPGLIEKECKDLTGKQMDLMHQMELANHPFTLDKQMMLNLKMTYLYSLQQAVKNENKEPSDALEIVALIMAYLKFSIKRYVDNIAMTIIHFLIEEFSKKIEEKLMDIFVHNDEESINKLIKEDDSTKYQREDMLNREKYLKEVLDKIIKFGI
ncbi:26390_t:CDS:2 [Dentiscutata erythropus]|uniref:26390_t:CDS:1 n=1 Tax=Dentiscutata erythropus TaxID=1348616 RepID=A0A9N9E2G7_9GLOM|nr:26390_t:CDS:2 [Dentiscutata erythropus]